jgi:ethanolaminephosphotransferase
MTATSSSASSSSSPKDQHKLHVWMVEPSIVGVVGGVLTPDGCEQIARHKYRPGSYTFLDTLLNPFWTQLTEWLPMWVAPNLVTTVGGCCCLVSYVLSVYYNNKDHQTVGDDYDYSSTIPRWLYFWNGFALFTYYTLDCMDGKQARRTNSSSPLGQLFDHGIDGLCNVSHIQAIQCIVQLPQPLLVTLQCSLQTAFFQAQW